VSLVLASGSASRRQILTAADVPFTAIPADVDEDALKTKLLAGGSAIDEVAIALAEAKALAVSALHPDALVLGADQTLLFEGALISKCTDMAAAEALLRRLRGKTHILAGGLALARGGEIVWRHVERSALTVRPFSEAFLANYLAVEGTSILTSVGCYKLEGLGVQLFERIAGDYFSILGLPLQPLLAELRRQGAIAT
jgi:septum formation protein